LVPHNDKFTSSTQPPFFLQFVFPLEFDPKDHPPPPPKALPTLFSPPFLAFCPPALFRPLFPFRHSLLDFFPTPPPNLGAVSFPFPAPPRVEPVRGNLRSTASPPQEATNDRFVFPRFVFIVVPTKVPPPHCSPVFTKPPDPGPPPPAFRAPLWLRLSGDHFFSLFFFLQGASSLLWSPRLLFFLKERYLSASISTLLEVSTAFFKLV